MRLAAERSLPARPSCKGFCDLMYLLPDGDHLLISQRALRSTPECQQPGFDAALCFAYSFSQVELNNAMVRPIPIPSMPECPVPSASCAYSVPSCDVQDVVPASSGSAVIRCNRAFFRVDPTGELSPPLSLKESAGYPVFGAELPEGSIRVITPEGRVYRLTSDNKSTAPGQLPIESGHRVDSGWRVDDKHVLLSANPLPPEDTYAETLLLVDLAKSTVVAEMKPSKEAQGVAVLDPARAVLLLQTNSGPALQQIDLVAGKLGKIVPMRGLPGTPTAVVR